MKKTLLTLMIVLLGASSPMYAGSYDTNYVGYGADYGTISINSGFVSYQLWAWAPGGSQESAGETDVSAYNDDYDEYYDDYCWSPEGGGSSSKKGKFSTSDGSNFTELWYFAAGNMPECDARVVLNW